MSRVSLDICRNKRRSDEPLGESTDIVHHAHPQNYMVREIKVTEPAYSAYARRCVHNMLFASSNYMSYCDSHIASYA